MMEVDYLLEQAEEIHSIENGSSPRTGYTDRLREFRGDMESYLRERFDWKDPGTPARCAADVAHILESGDYERVEEEFQAWKRMEETGEV